MSTSRDRETTGLPALVTVEEAAAILRIGRTKAYAMAREWRATGGRSGLPVVDLGNVLRVPLCQLEALIGAPITNGDLETASRPAPLVHVVKEPTVASDPPVPPPQQEQTRPTPVPRHPRRRPRRDQLDLFDTDILPS